MGIDLAALPALPLLQRNILHMRTGFVVVVLIPSLPGIYAVYMHGCVNAVLMRA